MYTLEMKRAFRAVVPPKNFSVQIIDHEVGDISFIEVVADENQFMRLLDDDKRGAVEYMVRVKDALEQNGAIVQLTRKAMEQK